jgi:putative transposase
LAGSRWSSVGSKKKLAVSIDVKRSWIDPHHPELSVRQQCALIGLNRASYYLAPAVESPANLTLMRQIDEQYLKTPFYGSRRLAEVLSTSSQPINRKHVQRLMRIMGITAVYPKPRTTIRNANHQIYPYLLRGLKIDRPNQVWSADITYIPMPSGFMYLVAVIDWYSRFVLAWQLSNTLDGSFCLEAIEAARQYGQPEIFNSDQGVQFTSHTMTSRWESWGVAISMDGRGRALDNVFIERLWWSVKYESIYINEFATLSSLDRGLRSYFDFYCHARPHQALDYRTPGEAYGKIPPKAPQKKFGAKNSGCARLNLGTIARPQ